MPHYRAHGKIDSPLTDQEFIDAMNNGKFTERKHKGYLALLFYTAVRNAEALRSVKEQFSIRGIKLFFDVGKRLKHGIITPSLNMPVRAPFVDEILWSIEHTVDKGRVWPYCTKTGYNIVNRVLPAYPHYFRLSRITNFFLEGWTIAQVHSWTGLTLKALNHYLGLVSVLKMGDSLGTQKNSVTNEN